MATLGFSSAPDPRYKFIRTLGSGSYGAVAAFRDVNLGQDVAMKRITQALDDFLVCRRTLREVKVMRHFCHRNLLHLMDVLPVQVAASTVYVITPLMDWDLDHMLRKKSIKLSASQVCSFLVQMLLGLLHLHSGHVIHRDLKPANIFVRKDGLVKIGDLGLSRGIDLEDGSGEALHQADEALTEYVVTRWYRAPEVILMPAEYGPPVDMWSVGCILYEMVTGRILFQGRSSFDQLRRIVAILGTPTGADAEWLQAGSARRLMQKLPNTPPRLNHLRANWHLQRDDEGMKVLLEEMLAFDPDVRPSLEASLERSCLAEARRDNDIAQAKLVAIFQQDYDKEFDALDRVSERRILPKIIKMLQLEVDNVRREPQQQGEEPGTLTPRDSIAARQQSRERPGDACKSSRETSASRGLGAELRRRSLSARAGNRREPYDHTQREPHTQRERMSNGADSAAGVATAPQRQYGRQPQQGADVSTSRHPSASSSTSRRSASQPRAASNPRISSQAWSEFQELCGYTAADAELRPRPRPAADTAAPSAGGPPPPLSTSRPSSARSSRGSSALAAAVAAAGAAKTSASSTRPSAAGGSSASAPFSAVARGDTRALAELAEDLGNFQGARQRRSCPEISGQMGRVSGRAAGELDGRAAQLQAKENAAASGPRAAWAGIEAWAAIPPEAKRDELLAAQAEAARRERERSAARLQAEEVRVQEPEKFLREVGLELQQRQRRRASDSSAAYGGAGGLSAAREEAVRRDRERLKHAVSAAQARGGGGGRGDVDEDEVVSNFLKGLHHGAAETRF